MCQTAYLTAVSHRVDQKSPHPDRADWEGQTLDQQLGIIKCERTKCNKGIPGAVEAWNQAWNPSGK